MNWKERVYCGQVSSVQEGQVVLLMGWVDALRDHGSLLFIHLRDVGGIVQVVFDPKVNLASYERAGTLREEYVVAVTGRVGLRKKGTENPNLTTGEIEIFADDLTILSESKALPFQISEKAMVFGEDLRTAPDAVDEELRLKYRYLDLRRPSVQHVLAKRYQIIKCIREYLDEKHFVEVETPILTKSTPEGARDYLVPSRVHHGNFYALPQSPQLFKQLLMMSGMDRYFQIVKCFRDEDLRPNRQPEFTQLDLEASFIDEEFIFELVEDLTVKIFALGNIYLQQPFLRLTYEEAMEGYGTDCPDLRFGMAFKDVTDIVKDTGYMVFRNVIGIGGCIKGFCVKGQAEALSKNVLQNEYALQIAPDLGAKGMTWMKVTNGNLESNIVQFFKTDEQQRLMDRFRAEEGDVLVMVADVSRVLVNKVLSSLRLHMADRLGLIPDGQYAALWVTDFPLFELKDDALSSQHHPFTMPDRIDFDPKDRTDLLRLKSRAYDLVVNGEELGGGSIRIHRMDVQKKIFQALGLGRDELDAKFGFFLKALEYGAPPHGGLALGLDRVISMILGVKAIRDVIAFPKNRSASCPLTQAPSPVDESQLKELNLYSGAPPERPARQWRRSDLPEASAHELRGSEKISRAEVMHVAKLGRLRLTGDEADLYRKDLNAILGYVETLNELDTENVHPMSHVLEMENVWRDDKSGRSKEAGPILSNAPEKEGDYFKVPKILEG